MSISCSISCSKAHILQACRAHHAAPGQELAAEEDGMASLSPEEHMLVSVPIDLPLCCHPGSHLDRPSCRRPLHVSLSAVITASGPLRAQIANDIWLLTSNASWSVSEVLCGPWVSKGDRDTGRPDRLQKLVVIHRFVCQS